MAERSLANRIWYDTLRWFFRVISVAAFRARFEGRQYVPPSGGALLLSNHQSYLDPIAVAVPCQRRLSAMARQTLFRSALLRWLIESLGAFPLDQEGSGLKGLKETLRRLRQGEIVLIYPEGERTTDGRTLPFKHGFAAIARRAHVPLIPVAIDGAFQSWPRWRGWPTAGILQIQFGRPIEADEVGRLSDEQLAAEAARRVNDCLVEARRRRTARCSRWQRMADRAVDRASTRYATSSAAISASPSKCRAAV